MMAHKDIERGIILWTIYNEGGMSQLFAPDYLKIAKQLEEAGLIQLDHIEHKTSQYPSYYYKLNPKVDKEVIKIMFEL